MKASQRFHCTKNKVFHYVFLQKKKSHFLKKSFMENLIFYAVFYQFFDLIVDTTVMFIGIN